MLRPRGNDSRELEQRFFWVFGEKGGERLKRLLAARVFTTIRVRLQLEILCVGQCNLNSLAIFVASTHRTRSISRTGYFVERQF